MSTTPHVDGQSVIGVVEVEVTPDVSAFLKALKVELAALELSLIRLQAEMARTLEVPRG